MRLKEPPNNHEYVIWAKGQTFTLVQSTIAGMGMDHSDGMSNHARCVDH